MLERFPICECRFRGRVILLAVFLATLPVCGQAQSPAEGNTQLGPPASAPARPTGRTTFHRTADQIQSEESKLSPELRRFLREFRVTSLLNTPAAKQARMHTLAAAIGKRIADAPVLELPRWLRLQQDAFAACGETASALDALQRRYELLGQTEDRDAVAKQATGEAEFSLAKRQFQIAHACYQIAERAGEAHDLKVSAAVDRAKVFSAESGSEAAISYLHELIDKARRSDDRELTVGAQFAVAAYYYRAREYERARLILLDVEASESGTEAAENAKKKREEWDRARTED